ncbi:MAG: hypothetical protein Q4G71_17775 [Pseudomonadota bacterium]|nr:hypothetical protein [Pseudomonadota bacterium]
MTQKESGFNPRKRLAEAAAAANARGLRGSRRSCRRLLVRTSPDRSKNPVIPAQAGIQRLQQCGGWIPACAGMTAVSTAIPFLRYPGAPA